LVLSGSGVFVPPYKISKRIVASFNGMSTATTAIIASEIAAGTLHALLESSCESSTGVRITNRYVLDKTVSSTPA